MKKSLLGYQNQHLKELYLKLTTRLNKHFASGRFSTFSKAQQAKLIRRIECIETQLKRLEVKVKFAGATLALGLALYSNQAEAQFAVAGAEFKVNTYTTDYQINSSVALDSDGDFVVVWRSILQDGSSSGIYAQRYNAAGAAQGAEFKVNTYTTNSQSNPSVAMDSDGDFVVVWDSNVQDGSTSGIYAQRYNAAGVVQGAEFMVNTYTTSYQFKPSVAMDSDGDFVVVWESSGQDGSNSGIYAQRFNAAGTVQGAEFRVNTYTTNNQSNPSVAIDSDGDFVVTWQSNNQDGSNNGIYAQRYNAAGVAQGAEFMVNTYTTNTQFNSSVAIDSDGDFAVTWVSYDQDGSGYGIYAQRYNAAGVVQGTEFMVNTYTTNYQTNPSVALDSDGDFVITWQSIGQDGSSYGIYAQRFDATGIEQGLEFKVNTYTTNEQKESAVAIDSNGDFVVAWQSYNQDGSIYGIYAQRYTNPITSINSEILSPTLMLHPNPAKERVKLNIEGFAKITMKDLSGQIVKETSIENQSFAIDGLKTGIYIVEITQEGKTSMQKLIIE